MAAESDLRSGAEDLRKRLAELDDQVADMLRGRHGAPGSAHTAAWELWHRGAAEVQVGLTILAKVIARAGTGRRVDRDALSDAVQRMAEFRRHAESVISEIDFLAIDSHASWSGRAGVAHAEAHRHWARGEAMMRESLARLRAAGATAHANWATR